MVFRYIVVQNISIHALREEGDDAAEPYLLSLLAISIHALREEGDQLSQTTGARMLYFYPRPPRGGRRLPLTNGQPEKQISIHALREEGDNCCVNLIAKAIAFLSTPSARRATIALIIIAKCTDHFYPRPPRGGRLCDLSVSQ